MRVVVIGGFGNFGARICRRLAEDSRFEILASGRSPPVIAPWAGVTPVRLDLGDPLFAEVLRALGPELVIHCAGPYQGQDYRVAAAAMAVRADYLDLADGREFVARFPDALQGQALASGRVAITGASTLPALSSAVVDRLREPLAWIDAIDVCIAPGQRAPRGEATMAAVLGYAGESMPWLEDGRWRIAHGWQELQRIPLAIGARWGSACDVPDLEVLPRRYPEVRRVTFRAALELTVQQLALWLVAGIRRAGVPLPMRRWAGPLNRLATRLDVFGSDLGGMRVAIEGRVADGRRLRRVWQLAAPGNHGPEIPCMATILIARRLAAGEAIERGAQICMGLLTLEDFAPEFAHWGISTRIEEQWL